VLRHSSAHESPNVSSNESLDAYRTYTQQELGLSNSEWQELRDFLDTHRAGFKTARQAASSELQPPAIKPNQNDVPAFTPNDWIGSYPCGLTVVADKFDQQEFQILQNDVAGWLEVLGPGTARALLPYFPERLHKLESLLLSYSQRLMSHTEAVFAGRPPVTTQRTRETSREPRGRPLIPATARERASGSQAIVSERITFTSDTLPNRLLVRFHAELASQLSQIASTSDALASEVTTRQDYHHTFATQRFDDPDLDAALETEFADPDVLAETRQLADGHMNDIIDLWEAYHADLTMQLDISEGFAATLKPLSKLYELWVLRQLLSYLTALIGLDWTQTTSALTTFKLGPDIRLQYDTSIKRHSRYLRAFAGNPGRPDFAIETKTSDGWTVQWIGDAKNKSTNGIDGNDAERFLRYLTDCLPAGRDTIGTLYCATGPQRDAVGTTDYTIEFQRTRPQEPDNQLLPAAVRTTLQQYA